MHRKPKIGKNIECNTLPGFTLIPIGYLLFLLLSLYAMNSWAQQSQRLHYTHSPSLNSEQQLLIRGENRHHQARVLVIRIDDRKNPPYAERINLERVVPPGPFKIQLALGGLHTPSARPLQSDKIQQIIVFQGSGDDGLYIEPLQIITPAKLSGGAKGWDLGPKGSALWPGFTAITPGFHGLRGKQLHALDRAHRKQAADALISDGIRGIDQLSLPLARGEWFITLWIRDPGEWEYLPHPLQRTIYANGLPVWSQNFTPQQWIKHVYLAGRQQVAKPSDDAWSLFGERPMGRISFAVTVTGQPLQLNFKGDQSEAGFVAAILAEQSSDYSVRQQVEQQRATWWRDNWRISPWPQASNHPPRIEPLQKSIVVAADSHGTLEFELFHDTKIGAQQAPIVSVQAPKLNGISLNTELRWGQWQLKRSGLTSTLLTPSNHYLRGGPLPPGREDGLPRRLHLNISPSRDTPAGEYHGELSITVGNTTLDTPLVITVPAVTLPSADRPIGLYLEQPVHFSWFETTRQQGEHAMGCDLRFLAEQGFTGIAPPLTTPSSELQTVDFIRQIKMTRDAGFLPPFFAYTPFKRLNSRLGLQASLTRIANIEEKLKHAGLPAPIWAIADEPSNPGQPTALDKIHRYASNFAPQAQLGGQLNHPKDADYLDGFDVVLINDGFGLNKQQFDRVQASGARPWLYNLANHRAAAGFFLWRIGAQGYLQWHARMPTADPFDPSDGREDDVQLLYPMAEPCPTVHDVNAKLFELREGITDLRWLLWLEQQAKQRPAAASLRQQLRHQIPDDWKRMEALSQEKLAHWRESIIQLAQ